MGLGRIKALLKGLGNPQNRFPIIHVAGTNGKGSTSAMLSSILTRAGYRVGLYTSPHLERFTERIKINDREIPGERVVELVERIKRKVQGSRFKVQRGKTKKPCNSPLTFFEFTTALAFLYFAEEEVDIAVLEVGLGGRLDATNVGNPIVSIITNVTRDHEDILGKGVTTIAREKAGIVRSGGILITTEKNPVVLKVLEGVCREKGTAIYRLGKEFRVKEGGDVFSFSGRRWHIEGLKTNLMGRHQFINAAASLAALEVVAENGYPVREETIRKGLKGVHWPGRLEVVSRSPLIVLDCAHNPGGARVLREALLDLRIMNYDLRFKIPNPKSQTPDRRLKIENRRLNKRLFLILGMMGDKDIKGFAKVLAPLAYQLILTVPETPRAAPLELLFKKACPYAGRVEMIEDVEMACRFALSKAGPDDLICVTGSIFTVGEARRWLINQVLYP